MTSLTPTLAVINGVPCASSLDIAEHFGKRHVDVMRAINNSITQVPEEFAQRNFAFSDYRDSTGRTLPKCDLTHDGFSFVVMGFTGKEAAKWKVVYITAFREMAERLTTAPASPDAPLSRRSDPERKALTAIINTWVSMAPIHYAAARAQVNAHFGVASMDRLTVAQVKEAIQWVQAKIDALPTDKESLTVAPPTALPFRADFPEDMDAGRKDALRKIRSIMDSMLAARSVVNLFLYPRPVNMDSPRFERLAHNAQHDFYAAALDCLSAAHQALEAGYRLGRQNGRG